MCRWLTGRIIKNGIESGDTRKIANGAGCLAAQYIKDWKKGAGGLYIHPSNVNYKDYDFSYIVTISRNGWDFEKKIEEVATIDVKESGKEIFTGSIPELVEYIRERYGD